MVLPFVTGAVQSNVTGFNMSTKLDKQLAENNAKIEQFNSRIEKLAEKRTGLVQRLKALREARKEDLVNGVNVDSLTKEINHINGQEQLFDDELQGLQEAITVLQGKGAELKAAIEKLIGNIALVFDDSRTIGKLLNNSLKS